MIEISLAINLIMKRVLSKRAEMILLLYILLKHMSTIDPDRAVNFVGLENNVMYQLYQMLHV